MSIVVRAAEQMGHRAAESVESGFNSAKRATVGGNETADKAQEGTHQAGNRLKETGNEILDGIKSATTSHPPQTTTTTEKTTDTRNL